MNMRRLEIFYRVVEEGGFTRAAAASSLTQPTLSAAVKLLEDELNVRLLDRIGREVFPTAAGELLHRHAVRIFALRQEALEELKSLVSGEQGELRLGGSTIPGTYLLPSLVADFSRKFPQIRVNLQLAGSQKISDELSQRRLDLALVGEDPGEKKLEATPCFSDELQVIVPSEHSWAAREQVSEVELLSVSLLLREQGSATRRILEKRLKEQGLELRPENVKAEVGGNEALKQGVRVGLGVAVISTLAVASELQHGELVALPLANGPLTRCFYLLQVKGAHLSPAAERFRSCLLERAQIF